jgi:hypothetical protein
MLLLKHKLFLFGMLGLLAMGPITKGVLCFNYLINQTEITQKYCENKAKPTMHCNGKCHLAKELDKQERQEKPMTGTSKFKMEIQEFAATICPTFQLTFSLPSQHTPTYFGYSEIRLESYLSEIFHPPTC